MIFCLYFSDKTVLQIITIKRRDNLPEIWMPPGILAEHLLGGAQKPSNSDPEHKGAQKRTSGCYSGSLDVWLSLGLLGLE
jgi:hypothetical protein